MNQYIDIYCERTEIGFWNEPVNAITNLLFLVAAFLIARQIANHRSDSSIKSLYILPILIGFIGIGSFLFHTFATFWAMYTDILPILLFQMSYLFLYARHMVGWSAFKAGGLTAGYFVISNLVEALPPYLNGSIGYIPALIFLAGLGIYHRNHTANAPWRILQACGVFTLSLTFRSLDYALCPFISVGVHFIWHILNALVLYMVSMSLIQNFKPSLNK